MSITTQVKTTHSERHQTAAATMKQRL